MDRYQSPKIVFPHIRKTGGTTVNNYLHGFFHEEDVLFDASTWEELDTMTFGRLQQVRFVRGHFEQTITDTFRPQNGFEIIGLLRDPVRRVISHYWHLMKAPDFDPETNFVRERNLSIEEFLELPECKFMSSNYQVAMYGSDERVGVDTVADTSFLDKAKAHIDRCSVVGVTEELGAFIQNLADHFGFASTPHTLGKTRSYTSNTDLSDDLVKKIERMNALDIELYDYARRKISKQKIKPKPKIHPLAIDECGFMRWGVNAPYSGTGWSDLQQGEIRHRWSTSSTASLNITRNYPGSMIGFVDIYRFVAEEQEDDLSVFINDDEVKLRRVHFDGPEQRLYFFHVPPSYEKQMELRFELDHMMSFSQVDPNSDDHIERGLALTRIGFDPAG